MRRFVAGWMFCLLVAVSGLAQTGTMGAAVPLEKTKWKLVRLGDAVVTANSLNQAHLALDPATHRVSGSGGCKRISGGYTLKGQKLTFGHVMSTMMACEGVIDTKQNWLKALGEVKLWKITGRQLTLMDGSGKAVAVFEVGDSGAKVG